MCQIACRQAESDDQNGDEARTGLASRLRGLVCFGLIDAVEDIAGRMLEQGREWPDAIEGLGDFLKFDADRSSADVRNRVEALIHRLSPAIWIPAVRYIVTNMPWDYPCSEDLDYDAQSDRQLAAVRDIADEVLQHPATLEDLLPDLTRGGQRGHQPSANIWPSASTRRNSGSSASRPQSQHARQ